jgi:hypothetical protein
VTRIADIAEHGELSEVVSKAVVETFTNMFGQNLAQAPTKIPPPPPNAVVMTYVKLSHNNEDMAFVFKFDAALLLKAAEVIFSAEYIKSNPVVEDIACEIANIVGGKVKSYLKEEGYYTDMGFPFLATSEEAQPLADRKSVPMHFFYTDTGPQKGVGVAVDFIVT